MDKNVKIYKQRGNTCSIACMMMVLEYYKVIFRANWYDERRLYKIFHSKHMDGTPFSALAFFMAKNGLNVTIYHENQDLFKDKRGVIDKNVFALAIVEYQDYLSLGQKRGVKVINGIDINISLLKQKLDDDNLIILAGEISGNYHAVLLTGYEKDNFKVCDPLYKVKQNKTIEELETFMDTSIGKWFIAVNNKNI